MVTGVIVRLHLIVLVCFANAKEIQVGRFRFALGDNNLSQPGCGTSPNEMVRIVNGRDAAEWSYPFAALLYKHNRPHGGASLIHPRWLITAAHNFDSTRQISVYSIGIGSANIDKLTTYKIQTIVCHPKYQINQHHFDIALVKLTTDIPLTIKPICMPTYAFQVMNSRQARTIGWGYHNFSVHQVSTILQEVDLDLISLEKCRDIYDAAHVTIERSQICTWNQDKDSCSGDSGGALFVYEDNKATLFGLVSFGVTCADQYPGVYTAISYYLDWIAQTMQTN